MTNNRKPVDEVRLSWDAKAAFKSLNAQGKRRQASIDDERLKTTPYTPPPNVAAWLQAQADKPKGRDYDAILRAAKKAPVGYYEDAPMGIKFGKPPVKPVVRCITDKNSLRILKRPVADNAIPRADVATGGGRVWTGILGNDVATKRACVLIGGTGYCRVRGNWHCLGEQSGEPTGEKVELFGTERDAILSECRKAMGL